MANLKITEEYAINQIQLPQFKSYMRDHIKLAEETVDGDVDQIYDETLNFIHLWNQRNLPGMEEHVSDQDIVDIIEQKKKPKSRIEKILYGSYQLQRSKSQLKDLWYIFFEKDVRKLVLTPKCVELIDTMKVDKNIRYDYLRTLPNRTDVISISKDVCLIYKKTDTRVLVVYTKIGREDVSYDTIKTHFDNPFINIDLVNEYYFTDNMLNDMLNETTNEKEDTDNYTTFVKIVSFIELGQTNLKVVPAKDKVGSFIKNNECKNMTKNSFILVDTSWNDISIRMDGFPVKGHLRLQPYGVAGNKHYKIIYIQPFMKNGYNKNHLVNADVSNIEFVEV